MASSATLSMERIKWELPVDFQKDQVHGNESMTFLAGKPRQGSRYSRIIKLVDCRVPARTHDRGQEPFVVVEFLESSRIFEASLFGHLGPQPAAAMECRPPDVFETAGKYQLFRLDNWTLASLPVIGP